MFCLQIIVCSLLILLPDEESLANLQNNHYTLGKKINLTPKEDDFSYVKFVGPAVNVIGLILLLVMACWDKEITRFLAEELDMDLEDEDEYEIDFTGIVNF